MKTLALDQSSHITGWAVFEDKVLLGYGKFELTHPDLGVRLKQIRERVDQMVKDYGIQKIVMEDVQYQ